MPLRSQLPRFFDGFVRVVFIVGALSLVLAGAPAWAQNIGQTTGQIEGVVLDATGAVLPGVTLTITSPALVAAKVIVTDGAGLFRAPGLAPGIYKVEAVLSGFTTVSVANIDLRAGQILKPNIKMSPGMKETVNVVASPVLDVLSTAVSSTLTSKTIDSLPKGRTWDTVVSLAPAVNTESTQGNQGLSFRGASISENSYIVDGVDTTAVVVGDSGQNVVLDFINEVQVKSGFVGADYGGALGGIVNVVTKSGSNTLRGMVTFQYSGSALTAGPRQTLRLNPTNSSQAQYITYPQDSMKQFDFGFTLGGKIIKDKVWFFGGWMPEYINTDRTVTFNADGQARTTQNRTRQNNIMGKITAQVANNATLNFSTSIVPNNSYGTLPPQDGTGSTVVDYTTIGTRSSKYSYSVGLDWVVRSNFFINAFAGYLDKRAHDTGVPVGNNYRYGTSNIGLSGVPTDFQHPVGFATLAPNFQIFANDDSRFSLGISASLSFNAAGRHLLKFGTQYARPTTYLKDGYTGEIMSLYWNSSFYGTRGTYGYYRVTDISQDGRVTSNNQALFVQDTWSLNKVTVNLGLRTERENLTPYRGASNATPSILFGFSQKLAPRLGVSWDVRGDSSWKIYANAGLFYDLMKQSAARDGFGGGTSGFYYYTLNSYDYTTLHAASPSGTLIYHLDFRVRGDTLDPAIKPARTMDIDGGTEFVLGKDLTASIGYVHRSVQNAIEDFNVSSPTAMKLLGNPGQGLIVYPDGSSYPNFPAFERRYDGLDLQLHKRFSNGWQGNIAYTYSRLWGNYDGLADADQQSTSDVNPNLGLYCDYLEGCYTSSGTLDMGPLATNRPHQLKLSGYYSFKFGLSVGAFFRALSGTPITPELGVNTSTITHPYGRGGAGTNPALTQTDLTFTYVVKVGGSRNLSLTANVLNVFNQAATLRTFSPMLNGSMVSVPIATYFAGYTPQTVITAQNATKDPRYLMPSLFQAPRSMRIGIKFDF